MPQTRKTKGSKKPAKRAGIKDLKVTESKSKKVAGGYPLVRLRKPGGNVGF